MRKLATFTLCVAVLALACTSIRPVVVTALDNGRTIDMVQGQELVLTLDSNHSTGFRWWLVDGDHAVLLPSERPEYEATSTDTVGAGGVETWRFKAAQAGSHTLRFEYKRSFEEKEPPAKILTYTVVVVP